MKSEDIGRRVNVIMEQSTGRNMVERTKKGYDCNEHDHPGPYAALGIVVAVGGITAAAVAVYTMAQYWQ